MTVSSLSKGTPLFSLQLAIINVFRAVTNTALFLQKFNKIGLLDANL